MLGIVLPVHGIPFPAAKTVTAWCAVCGAMTAKDTAMYAPTHGMSLPCARLPSRQKMPCVLGEAAPRTRLKMPRFTARYAQQEKESWQTMPCVEHVVPVVTSLQFLVKAIKAVAIRCRTSECPAFKLRIGL